MYRHLRTLVLADAAEKMVIITGPRQCGKTTLCKSVGAAFSSWQYLNYDIPPDRNILLKQSWSRSQDLVIFDEIHKMPDWKNWLKGIADGRDRGREQNHPQAVLVTGSARMDTFRQGGDSLAGRYFHWRLHPLSVRELTEFAGPELAPNPTSAMQRLLQRGGFPEPCLAKSDAAALRWRKRYLEGLLREDILDMARVNEVYVMRTFVQALRLHVGSPLSLASLARDMSVSPITLKRYLEILEALYIVFTVRPWSRNITRATLQAPKVYFFDTGLVLGDEGVMYENLVACHLLKRTHFLQDSEGRSVDLHYIRTKDDAEVDFCLSEEESLTHLIECKVSEVKPQRALLRFAAQWPEAEAVQLVRDCLQDQDLVQESGATLKIRRAAEWLNTLPA